MPTGNQINVISRWHFQNDKGLVAQLSLKVLEDKRLAGEKDLMKILIN